MATWLRSAFVLVVVFAASASLASPVAAHPWIPNGAPWPWNLSAAQGSYTNANGGTSYVRCLIEVGSDNPNWAEYNMRWTRWAGGARCEVQMKAITGTSRLYQWNGAGQTNPQIASVAIGAQHEVPDGHGFGWQAYGLDYYNRTSNSQYLQIKVEVALEHSQAWWNSYPQGCQRDVSNGRILRCELWSPPFQQPPYPCPSWEIGAQPGGCSDVPQPCSQPEIGLEPNCFSSPPPCPAGQTGVEPVCAQPPTNTSPPTVTGTARQGHTLRASPGSWAGTDPKAYFYQWRRCNAVGAACEDVPHEVQQTMKLSEADVGHTMRVAVTAVNGLGSGGPVSSTPTGIVLGDSQGPQLTVTGPVRQSADGWVEDGTHAVAVNARDGSDTDPQTGVRRIELLIDGSVRDSVERPCLSGNCELEHTFSVDTGKLRYGAHDFVVRAIDEGGNATVDPWVVATEPMRTVFELSSPASLEEVYAAAVANQADIMDMRHADPGVGGYSTGDQPPSDAIPGYRESYQGYYGVSTDPPVTVVTFGGVIATETLGPMAARVATRDVMDLSEIASEDWPDIAEPSLLYKDDLFNADVAADSELYDMRDDPDAAVSAAAKKFSPAYGKMWTYDTPPVERVQIHQTMRWKESSLDAFERSGYLDHGYEHDVKLYDNSYTGSRKHPFCSGPSWWATRRIVEWYSDYPDDANPYLDENVGDSCQVLDLTIGIEYPLELEERRKYYTLIITEEGGRNQSPYQLVASKLARNCPGDPRYCAVRSPGGDSQLLIGKTRGEAPECRRWRKGRRSRNCDPA